MLKTKEIENLFSDFCHEWDYSIVNYDEFIGTLLLKHRKYSDIRESYIYIDLCNTTIRTYCILTSQPYNLFSDCLQYKEIRDLMLVLSLIFKKLEEE